jgi:hypothetical protein
LRRPSTGRSTTTAFSLGYALVVHKRKDVLFNTRIPTSLTNFERWGSVFFWRSFQYE